MKVYQSDSSIFLMRIVFVGMLLLLAVLNLMIWRLQLSRGDELEQKLTKNSVRRVRVPGSRGRIYARGGECLADNAPNYAVAVYLEELRQAGAWSNTANRVEHQLDLVADNLGRKSGLSNKKIRSHIRQSLYQPLLAFKGLSETEVARWAENNALLEGLGIYAETGRVYPYGSLACHVLGYVGKADAEVIAKREEEQFHHYLPEMIGRSGLESRLDERLRGEAGGKLLRIDVSGFRHDNLAERPARCGDDLLLTLDLGIQQAVEKAISGRRGACVVMDPRNGDVLAMASSPSYDLNPFSRGISQKLFNCLRNDPGLPLFNRAASGKYPPGSTFKPVTALAGLENGTLITNMEHNCKGYIYVGKKKFRCGYGAVHGPLVLTEALTRSCNVFFYEVGMETGIEAMWHMGHALGLGEKTGLQITAESAGLLPDPAWKRRRWHEGWRDGDTCNFAIGQGAVLTTPLQMAAVTATIANGGKRWKPRIVKGWRASDENEFSIDAPKLLMNLNWKPGNIQCVREGMRGVVMAPKGTGRSARIPSVVVAGKTGTAEYGKKGSGQYYGWMIAFAPYENPRYAVAMVFENAIGGGSTAGPRMHDLFETLFSEESGAS